MSNAKRFMEIFRGLDRAHGIYSVEGKTDAKGKMTGRAKTVKEPVTEKVWDQHLMGKTGLGVIPLNDEGLTGFGAIDVDIYGLNLESLESKITTMKLPLVVCRTKSGGAHLYLFLRKPTAASLVREKLMEWSILMGYPQVEVFPKQSELAGEDDIGSWINMPYFGGDRTTRYAIVNGKNLTMEEFIKHVDRIATDAAAMKKLVIVQDEALAKGPPCLQYLAQSGFPEGARNLGLFDLGIFCKMKFGDDWKDKVHEFNKKYLAPPLEMAEVNTVIKSVDRKSYFYRCKEPPISSFCNRSICSKREFGINKSGNDPGITMDGMTKILMDPPIWMMNVDGKRIKLNSADEFLQQMKFTKACVESHNILPNKISENAWRDLIRGLLDKVEEIEAPEDVGVKGEFFAMLEKYCSERIMAKHVDELLIGKPWLEEEWVMFRSTDMIEWMRKKKLNIGSREAWNYLREIKAKTKALQLKGKHIRVWMVPVFSKQTEPFDVPDTKKEDDF
jgi:hypothetical protein